MREIVEYSDAYAEAWADYVDSDPNTNIAHQIGWKDVISKGLGHTPKYFIALDDSQIVGILPIFKVKTWWNSKYLISLPWIDYGGIAAVDLETEKSLLKIATQIVADEKIDFLELRSVNASGIQNLTPRQDKVTFLLKLESDPDIVWKGFNAKLRNQIRKAMKSELTTELGRHEFLDSFYEVFSHNMRDLGTPVWGKSFFKTILSTFPNSSQIILVKKDQKVMGAGLVLSFKDRVYVPSASSYRSANKFCPNHALYWSVIEKACKDGFGYFDFGRSTRDGNTFRFKKQWTPDPTQLTWQYYLGNSRELPSINPSNPKYRLFIEMWKRMPLPLANILGPKIIRNFP